MPMKSLPKIRLHTHGGARVSYVRDGMMHSFLVIPAAHGKSDGTMVRCMALLVNHGIIPGDRHAAMDIALGVKPPEMPYVPPHLLGVLRAI